VYILVLYIASDLQIRYRYIYVEFYLLHFHRTYTTTYFILYNKRHFYTMSVIPYPCYMNSILDGLTTTNKLYAPRIIRYSKPKHKKQIH